MSKSQWNGAMLPSLWTSRPSGMKQQVIVHLQGRTLTPPSWWETMSLHDRTQVVLHLCAVGSVSARNHSRVRKYGLQTYSATRKAEDADTRPHMMDIETSPIWPRQFPGTFSHVVINESTPIRQGMLYPPPNGGKRVLPSVYTKLADRWLRANGVYNRPEMMNQGHLKNCVALLNESHINFVDKATHMLGKMHAHLGNRPDLQAKLVDLFHDFEALQVDELYPIVELLASHIELTEDDVEFSKEDFDTPDLDKW